MGRGRSTRSRCTHATSQDSAVGALHSTKRGKVSKNKSKKNMKGRAEKTMDNEDSNIANLDDSVVALSLDDSQPSSASKLNTSEGPCDSDCSICLQKALHPVKLPCSHMFCYLCIKGVVHTSGGQCALCRAPVPRGFIFNPEVVELEEDEEQEEEEEEKYKWYYEGRSGGWWEYDARTSQEIETTFSGSEERQMEILIAGYIYIIDLDAMVQKRKVSQHIQRKIKRDKDISDKKGVAGIRSRRSRPT